MGETISKSITACTCPSTPTQSDQRLDRLEESVARLLNQERPCPPPPVEVPSAPPPATPVVLSAAPPAALVVPSSCPHSTAPLPENREPAKK